MTSKEMQGLLRGVGSDTDSCTYPAFSISVGNSLGMYIIIILPMVEEKRRNAQEDVEEKAVGKLKN